MRTDSLFQLLGLLLCGASFGFVAVSLVHQVQSLWTSRRRWHLEREVFMAQLKQLASTANSPTRIMGWEGFRKFRVQAKLCESQNCHSFYLIPADATSLPLPQFQPGQFVPVRLTLPGINQPLTRCYSLSDRPRDDVWRITVKQAHAASSPTGSASHYLNTTLREGMILELGTPRGAFCIDPLGCGPIVLIGGGIGITPLWSMLVTLAELGRLADVHLFYGVRNSQEFTFREPLRLLRQQFPQLRVCVCFSQPHPEDRPGHDYDHIGRITPELIRRQLSTTDADFYLCGPGSFVADLREGLAKSEIPATKIHTELFGPASASPVNLAMSDAITKTAVPVPIEFVRSQLRGIWNDRKLSLLDVGESLGVTIPSDCRVGACGTCSVKLLRGEVAYDSPPSCALAPGSCLPCIARPRGPVALDA